MNFSPFQNSQNSEAPPRRKQILLGLAAVLGVLLVLALIKFFQLRAIMAEHANQGAPPQTVSSSIVEEGQWPITFEAVASLRAVQGAQLSAEENGRVTKIGFQSGSPVKQGDLLVALDASAEEAELAGIHAQLALADLTAKRQRALRTKNATSQSTLDTAESQLLKLLAERDRLQSLIRRKTILAPFGGHAGIRSVNVGQMIRVGDPIVTLQDYEKLFVDFTLPQKVLGSVSVGARVEVFVDAFPDTSFVAQVSALESAVDGNTRSIGLQASLDNTRQILRPGMFAKVRVITPVEEKVLSIPATSIQYAPYGNSVYVIARAENAENAESPVRPAEAVTVKLGRQRGDRIAVLSGLQAGQEIVSSGTFKMHPGVQVMVNNNVQPGNELAPSPEDS